MERATADQKVISLKTSTFISLVISITAFTSSYAIMQTKYDQNVLMTVENRERIKLLEQANHEKDVQFAEIKTRLIGIETLLLELKEDRHR